MTRNVCTRFCIYGSCDGRIFSIDVFTDISFWICCRAVILNFFCCGTLLMILKFGGTKRKKISLEIIYLTKTHWAK